MKPRSMVTYVVLLFAFTRSLAAEPLSYMSPSRATFTRTIASAMYGDMNQALDNRNLASGTKYFRDDVIVYYADGSKAVGKRALTARFEWYIIQHGTLTRTTKIRTCDLLTPGTAVLGVNNYVILTSHVAAHRNMIKKYKLYEMDTWDNTPKGWFIDHSLIVLQSYRTVTMRV